MGSNPTDKVLGELLVGIENEHVGRVAGILSSMDVETADEVVIKLKELYKDVMVGAPDTEPFLRKVMSKKPLKGRALAVAILACLRKEPTEGTYELAEQLLATSGESLETLAHDLRDAAATHPCPSAQLRRFWHDNFHGLSSAAPAGTSAIAAAAAATAH
mmetsp:Transcript_2209/g.5060  ORF Transcript_2209/g.5060 Transcript_2209/m.5060 type:complete len:160 (-) Transcript_2209:267-746(-)